MKTGALHLRLLLLSWMLLVCFLALVFWRHYSGITEDLVQDTESRAVATLDVADWLIRDKGTFKSPEAFQDWVGELGKRLGYRITYIVDGRVAADSEVPFADLGQLEDHAGRPEVLAAAGGGIGLDVRRSATLGTALVYAARRTAGTGGAGGVPPGILRLAVPYSQVQERLARDTHGLLLILVTTLAGTGLLVLWLTRRMAGTIKVFSATAKAIGDGDFESRIRVWPGSEFQPLAETVNAMAKKIRRQLKTIEDQANEHTAVFEGMAEGVAVIGGDGRILAHNRALAGMFPSPLGLVGRHPLETGMDLTVQESVAAGLSGPESPDEADGSAGGIEGETAPIPVRVAGGRQVEVTRVVFHDHKSRRRLILVFRDVSGERRAADILRSFVIDASHRLRTPLTSIKGYAETLLDNPPKDPEAGRALMSIILKNANVMSAVVTDLLSRASSQYSDRQPDKQDASQGGA